MNQGHNFKHTVFWVLNPPPEQNVEKWKHTYNWIIAYHVTFRNNHICFIFHISFNRNRTTFAGTIGTFSAALNTLEICLRPGLGHKRILLQLKARDRVRWLQMSWKLIAFSHIPQLDLRGHFRRGKYSEWKGREGKAKKGKGRKIHPNKFLVTALACTQRLTD